VRRVDRGKCFFKSYRKSVFSKHRLTHKKLLSFAVLLKFTVES